MPMTLLEIFPKSFTPTHYYWLAKELSFHYDTITGTMLENNCYSVNISQLINKVQSTLTTIFLNNEANS